MNKLKSRIKSRIDEFLFEHGAFSSRYKDGATDLKKGISQGRSISSEQEMSIREFWAPYVNTKMTRKAFDIRWFDIYNRTNVFGFDLKYYIPDSYYYCIVDPFFADYRQARSVDDKNFYDLFFHDIRQPRTICRKVDDFFLDDRYGVITEDVAIQRCLNEEMFIIKPSVGTCSGSGIRKFCTADLDREELARTIQNYKSFVVQEYITQHSVLSSLSNSCVNTLRLVTLLFESEVYVVASVVIMGGKDAVTNHLHRGGLVCGIKPDGFLRDTAFDGQLNQYNVHPNGIVFKECLIPGYAECVNLVKNLAPRFSQVSRLIGWDFTIGTDGHPILIETNLSWGGLVQIASGPVFGEMTPDVLEFMRKGGMKRMTK